MTKHLSLWCQECVVETAYVMVDLEAESTVGTRG